MVRLRHLLAASALSLIASAFAACGTDAMGTDACRKIEQARCRKGPACPELHVQAGTGVEECVQFARDRCLHGLPVADPGPAVVDPCVAAIEAASTCDVVVSPATLPACAFLQPSPASDGGPDAAEAATEDASDAPEGPAEGG